MHFCSAYIMLGGDPGNVMVRDAFNPVSWPEIGVLQFLHGEDAVFNITPVRFVPQRATEEKSRLASIYDGGVVEQLYPGKNPVMEMTMPGAEPVEGEPVAKTSRKAKGSVTIEPLDAGTGEDA